MSELKIYEIDEKYVNYLSTIEPHLFHNKKVSQLNTRKYIGVVFMVNKCEYFAPLSSFKSKHNYMNESLDFLKIKHYAVINLNNMFPVPKEAYSYVDFSKVLDYKYRTLLMSEYRYIKFRQDKIKKNALTLYNYKIKNGNSTALAKRCNDFKQLEKACIKYKAI